MNIADPSAKPTTAGLLPVEPFDLLIFGGTGDLARRKLLPALYHRHADGQLPPASRIIAIGHAPMALEDYLATVGASLEEFSAQPPDLQTRETFFSRFDYVDVDVLEPESWLHLMSVLPRPTPHTRIAYLATAPSLFGPIAEGLHQAGLIQANMRIVLEKPVGEDFDSAKAINDAVGVHFPEDQIYRIDHYLGKETVQNLLALRFGNALFEPLWRREVIDHVQITVAEELGVANRIQFYNKIGALRDMVQNHLLQLLCLIAMEPPASLDHEAVRDEKLKVLRALKPIAGNDAQHNTVRAQYDSGVVTGQPVDSFPTELGTASDIETFVALRVEIENWRWSGVPFYLRTGKRLAAKHSEIAIHFKSLPHSIFGAQKTVANKLSILLQPNEGMELSIMAKQPGTGTFNLSPVSLDLSFEDTFGMRYPDAYERLIIEVMRGNPALFMRRDEVEAAWQWIDQIRDAWTSTEQPVERYMAGSWGPTAAAMLLGRDARKWDIGA
jgi:glucose-6-phosphate 1-dehydrogenase